MGYKPLTKWHAHPCGDEFRESICGPPVDHGHIPPLFSIKSPLLLFVISSKMPMLSCLFDPQMSLMTPKKKINGIEMVNH